MHHDFDKEHLEILKNLPRKYKYSSKSLEDVYKEIEGYPLLFDYPYYQNEYQTYTVRTLISEEIWHEPNKQFNLFTLENRAYFASNIRFAIWIGKMSFDNILKFIKQKFYIKISTRSQIDNQNPITTFLMKREGLLYRYKDYFIIETNIYPMRCYGNNINIQLIYNDLSKLNLSTYMMVDYITIIPRYHVIIFHKCIEDDNGLLYYQNKIIRDPRRKFKKILDYFLIHDMTYIILNYMSINLNWFGLVR